MSKERMIMDKCEYCADFVYSDDDYLAKASGGFVGKNDEGFPEIQYRTVYWHKKCEQGEDYKDERFLHKIAKEAREEEKKELEVV